MNEVRIPENDRVPVREDERGIQRAGRNERHACRYANYTGGGIAATLDASYYKGPGARNGREREFLAIENEPVVYPGVGITSPENRSDPQPGDPSCALTNDSRNYLVQEAQPPRKYIVRRLTPTECARLQGFPDEWCEGLGGSDSAIYKAYGNGLALPCAYDVMQRIARFVERERRGTTSSDPGRAGATFP